MEIVKDAGLSAEDMNRPGLQRVLEMLGKGEVGGLLVAKLDRLTRSVRDLSDLLENYFGTKYALLSVAEKVDTSSAAGRMILNIMATVSQWEREVIGERTSAALRHKQAKGEWVGAPALGYEVVNGSLEEVAGEQATIQRIRELAAEGLVLRDIADTLTEEGFETKRGGAWHPQTVARILKRAEAQG